MSCIAVSNIPANLKMHNIIKLLMKTMNGTFKVINIFMEKKGMKQFYLKLSPRVNPTQAVENINSKTRFRAYIPEEIPDSTMKVIEIPNKLRMQSNLPSDDPPSQVFVSSHYELLCEMQSKYTGLYNLSKKTGHKLLDSIARTVFDRLKEIIDTNPEVVENGFKMTQVYRRMHPHFGDFQLILSALHQLQDAAGAPRADLAEHALAAVSQQPCVIDNIPLNKLQSSCNKYTERITKKIKEHLSTLDCEVNSEDSEEIAAQKKVREQLIKLNPYLNQIVRQVITNHFIPDKAPFLRVRMYGEPFMPRKELIAPIAKKCRAVHFLRSDRMFNMMRFSIPLHQYSNLIRMDGHLIGGAKLVIRSSDVPRYEVCKDLKDDIRALFGMKATDNIDEVQEEVDPDDQIMEDSIVA